MADLDKTCLDSDLLSTIRIKDLTKKELKELENLLEENNFEVNLKKEKNLSFLYKVFRQEETKNVKKQRNSQRRMKNAEKMILSLSALRRTGQVEGLRQEGERSRIREFGSGVADLFTGRTFQRMSDRKTIAGELIEAMEQTKLVGIQKMDQKEREALAKRMSEALVKKQDREEILELLKKIAREESREYYELLFDAQTLNRMNSQEVRGIVDSMNVVRDYQAESELLRTKGDEMIFRAFMEKNEERALQLMKKRRQVYSGIDLTRAIELRKKLERETHEQEFAGKDRSNWGTVFRVVIARGMDPQIPAQIVDDVRRVAEIRYLLRELPDREHIEKALGVLSSPTGLESLYRSVVKKFERKNEARIRSEALGAFSEKEEEKIREMATHIREQFFIGLESGERPMELARQWYKTVRSLELARNRGEKTTEEDFVLVHLTRYIPTDGIIHTQKSAARTSARASIHFCLNGPVSSHDYGNWDDTEIAVIVPLVRVKPLISNLNPVDTYIFGDVRLPKGTVILVTKRMAAEKGLKDGQTLGNAVVEVVEPSYAPNEELFNPFRWRVTEKIAEMGYLPMAIGMWNFASWGAPVLGNIPIAKRNGWGEGEQHSVSISSELEDIANELHKHPERSDLERLRRRLSGMSEALRAEPGETIGQKRKVRELNNVINNLLGIIQTLEGKRKTA